VGSRNFKRLSDEKRTYGVHGVLYKNAAAKKADLRESLGVKKFFLRWYCNLLGIETHDGKSCGTFQEEEKKIQDKIDNLLLEQIKLRSQYESAPKEILRLEQEIAELTAKLSKIKTETKDVVSKIKRAENLKERIKILTEELLDDNIDINDLENLMSNLEE